MQMKENGDITIVVNVPYGAFEVSLVDGSVVEYNSFADCEYSNIERFDVVEFINYFKEFIDTIAEVDILDIGYMTEDGNYVPPDNAHRFITRANLLTVSEKMYEYADGEELILINNSKLKVSGNRAYICEGSDLNYLESDIKHFVDLLYDRLKIDLK